MILKSDTRVLTLGALTIYPDTGNTTGRFVFDTEAVSGFYDGAGARREATERPISDGDFAETATHSSRVITVTGYALAGTVQELHSMRDEFIETFGSTEYEELSVTNGSGTRYMTVSLEGVPAFVQINDVSARWKVDLYAPDPRMYSELERVQLQSAGDAFDGLTYPLTFPMKYGTGPRVVNLPLTNTGNTATWPTFTVTGDYPSGFKIRNYPTGEEVIYSGAVFMASPVTIDFASGSATVGGVDRTYLLTKRQWFAIPPNGQPIKPRFIPYQEGQGWCDVTYRSAWI